MDPQSDNLKDQDAPDEAAGPDDAALRRDLRALKAVLRKTGRAYRRPLLLEGALWYLVTLCAVVMSVLLIAVVVPAVVPAVSGWMLLVGVCATTLGAAGAWVGFQVGKDDPEQVATLVQRHCAGFRNDLVAALEFGRRLLAGDQMPGFSPAMARAHVHRTVGEVVGRCKHASLGHLLPRRELSAPAMSLAACAALLAIPAAVSPTWMAEVLTSPATSAEVVADAQPEARPVVGDLYIYYATPPYTGLGRKMDAFSTGHIETIVGTEVTIEAYPLIDHAAQVELVIDTDDGSRSVVMDQVDGPSPGADQSDRTGADRRRSKLRASFVAVEPGSYHFRATLDDGAVVDDGAARRIELIADHSPEVSITSHDGVVEVSPDDVLEVNFDLADDFGLATASRTWHFGGDDQHPDKQPLDLPELSNTPKQTSGSFKFDLAPLGLQPKDVVVLSVRATDNNTLTGPGVGHSQPLRLRVSSPQDKHLEYIARQQQILDQLVDLMAGYLEGGMGPRQAADDGSWRQRVPDDATPGVLLSRFRHIHKLQPSQKRIIESMDALVEDMADDPLMVERDFTLFSAFHDHLADLHKDGRRVLESVARSVDHQQLGRPSARRTAAFASRAEASLEKGILRFEELLSSQKMESIKATAQEIDELKNRVKRLLKKYQDSKDPQLKKAILREIHRLRQRMNELMRRMQMQLEKLPQEHMNMDAIKQKQLQSDSRKMADNLQKVENMLQNGDVEGALKALDNMETNLDSLTESMGKQFDQAQPRGLSEMDKKVSELMDGVNDLKSAEKDLEQDTSEFNEQLAKKRRAQIDRMLDKFTAEMLQRVKRQKDALDRMQRGDLEQAHREGIDQIRQKLDDLADMLRDKDIAQSLEEAKHALEATRRLRLRLDLSGRYSTSGDQKEAIKRAQTINDAVEKRGQATVDDLQDMMDQAQQKLGAMNQQRMDQLGRRQQKISEQAEQLDQKIGKASKRFPMLKQQLQPSMDQSRKAMKDAQRGLGKRRTQRALDSERAALNHLGTLKNKMKKTVQKKRRIQRSKGPRRDRQVDIPGQADHRAGKQLRKDVMDAMKEDKLDDYESEIERYYKSIME